MMNGSGGLTDSDEPGALYYGLSMETWLKVGILGALLMAVYWLVLRWLWDKTNPVYGEANWGHAICIPVIGLYYLYVNREELLKLPVRPTWMGLGVVIVGLVSFAYGIWPGQNQFLQGCAMILALLGVVLLLCGWQIMKIAWFPIVYLICGIPWPPLVYSYIASPLQTLAAKVAVRTLQITGVNAFRTGTRINMGDVSNLRTLNVAEACAGLRSLMTFITVGAAVAFLSARPLWQKILITISAIPIAIFCNVMRVAGQGLLDHYISRQLSESFAHQFVGLVMLIPAFFLILLVGWVIDHIFIEEAEAVEQPAGMRGAGSMMAAVEAPRRVGTVAPAKMQAGEAEKLQAPAPAKPQPAGTPLKPLAPAKTVAPAPAGPKTVMPPRGVMPPRPAGMVTPPRPNRNVPPPPRREGP